MYFNSIDFALFLPCVFILYWFVFGKSIKLQNLLIALSSYIFYGWWDWKFLILIVFSTIVDFSVGIGMAKSISKRTKKLFLFLSLFTNLSLLAFFKYYNFFAENFSNAFTFFGKDIQLDTLYIILPVGISFYTFQTLSYSIDVYRNRIHPTSDYIAFSAFVSFFPQLVAGPIERASNLLPQFLNKRHFNYDQATDGLRQILWGLFKKIVIANNCAEYANNIFDNSYSYSGSTLFIGALFFSFQIYGDFSGYSDIAIGTSRLFGFKLMQNFAFPYFSKSVSEFWRRWHISLSTWFRDYLYIPIGGSRGSHLMKTRNVLIVFLISGLWHGANWTFIFWGLLNALLIMPAILLKKKAFNKFINTRNILSNLKEFGLMLSTFLLTVLMWVMFRAENINHALNYYKTIFSRSLFNFPIFQNDDAVKTIILLLLFFFTIEWLGRGDKYALESLRYHTKRYIRWTFYILIITMIFYFEGQEQAFIYFQF